jgi:F0F1-type ATP synthase alpha subunit
MIADQHETGIIESIFDGIARLSGLDTVFYAELLYSINMVSMDTNKLFDQTEINELNKDELEEIILNEINEFDENNDELEENSDELEENDATIEKTLMLVMGLERESILAPMLTQTTQLYEGDLAWRTEQELEIYCSIESLGRISDIFLNSLE